MELLARCRFRTVQCHSRPIRSASTLPSVEVHVSLVGRKDLTGEIYRQLRQAILDGRLPPGEQLPPTRELAQRLAVSRTTVTVAYDRLMAEGFVSSRVGAGTFVSDHGVRRPPAGRPAASPLRPRAVWDDTPLDTVRGLYARSFEFDFRSGVPDHRLFPYRVWRRLVSDELQPLGATDRLGLYGDPAGHAGLRAAIARHIGVSRAVRADAEDVTVTNGTQQALDLVARAFLEPGEGVAVEEPGFPPHRRLLTSLGAKVAPVPVDDEGLVVDALPEGTRLVLVTPSHQFPLGVAMSLPRRVALLSWAERHDAAIVEDDYDSEFRFGGRPIEPLQTLDTSGRVIYVGSFSKTMLPSLRLGFVVTPPSLTRAARSAKYVTDWYTALAAQAALARFIDEGHLARHVRKLRAVYAARHERIVEALRGELNEHLRLLPSDAGLHVSAPARRASADELRAVAKRAAGVGVGVDELASYAVDRPQWPGLVLGYGAIAVERIDEGLRRLRACFDG